MCVTQHSALTSSVQFNAVLCDRWKHLLMTLLKQWRPGNETTLGATFCHIRTGFWSHRFITMIQINGNLHRHQGSRWHTHTHEQGPPSIARHFQVTLPSQSLLQWHHQAKTLLNLTACCMCGIRHQWLSHLWLSCSHMWPGSGSGSWLHCQDLRAAEVSTSQQMILRLEGICNWPKFFHWMPK